MAFWSTKAAISLKRVKIQKSYYGRHIENHLRSLNGTIPNPLRPPLPQDLGSHTQPKLQSLLSQERPGKATNFKFGHNNNRVHPIKSPWTVLEKRKRGHIQGLPIFGGTPYYFRNGKSYVFQIWPVYSECPSEQKAINFLEKSERGLIQGLPILGGTLYYLRNGKSYGFRIWPVHSECPSK